MELFDSHLHLDDEAFHADREDVIERARAAGVVGMVTIGTDPASSRAAIGLAEQYDDVFASIAVHPHGAGTVTARVIDELRDLAAHPKIVAVGETGLDFVKEFAPRDSQVSAFRAHVRLSRQTGLPVIIHCRRAHQEALMILQEEGARAVIMHAYSGSPDQARECARRGYLIALGGPVTFKNARTLTEVAKMVPDDLLLAETDAPVLTPEPHRGRRNEPAFVRHIVERLAELRGQRVERVAEYTTMNARRVYRVHQS